MTITEIIDILNKRITTGRFIINADMRLYTSFKAGGRADLLTVPQDEKQLISLLQLLNNENVPYIIMGNGSNILVKDGGYRGVIIKIDDGFSQIEINGNSIIAGAGALMSKIAKKALEAELAGFEFASGIPGSIGGGVFMNAGAYGGEIADVIEYAEVLNRDTCVIKKLYRDELELSYRHSCLQQSGDIVLRVKLNLKQSNYDEISALMQDLTARRNEKQPVQYPSAGSFFKRPEGYFAGKLVQDAGLKGLALGGAKVSSKHSGFIINTGNATASDILELMKIVQNTVYDKFGVIMEPEVRIIGEDA